MRSLLRRSGLLAATTAPGGKKLPRTKSLRFFWFRCAPVSIPLGRSRIESRFAWVRPTTARALTSFGTSRKTKRPSAAGSKRPAFFAQADTQESQSDCGRNASSHVFATFSPVGDRATL